MTYVPNKWLTYVLTNLGLKLVNSINEALNFLTKNMIKLAWLELRVGLVWILIKKKDQATKNLVLT